MIWNNIFILISFLMTSEVNQINPEERTAISTSSHSAVKTTNAVNTPTYLRLEILKFPLKFPVYSISIFSIQHIMHEKFYESF